MERLTDTRVGYTKLQDNTDIDEVVDKLGQLEDILEKHNLSVEDLDNVLEVLEILKRMLFIRKRYFCAYLDVKEPFFNSEENLENVKDWLEQ